MTVPVWVCPDCNDRLARGETVGTTWEAGPNECLFCRTPRLQVVPDLEDDQ